VQLHGEMVLVDKIYYEGLLYWSY